MKSENENVSSHAKREIETSTFPLVERNTCAFPEVVT